MPLAISSKLIPKCSKFLGEYDGAAASRAAAGSCQGRREKARSSPAALLRRFVAKPTSRDSADHGRAMHPCGIHRPELGPKGVHVAYVLIDAVIDLGWTRKRFADAPDNFFIQLAAIANEVWHVVHQDRSAWSLNVEVRPFRETW